MKTKLLVAIPTTDYMHFEFVRSLTALVEWLKDSGIDYEVRFKGLSLVYAARDNLTCYAINNDFTDVLWLDSDMVFEPNILEDLQFCGKPFVTGVAHSRRPPYVSCTFTDIALNSITRVGDYPQEPFRIAGCGFACVLIKTEILKHVLETYKTCFLPMPAYGEDVAFCKRATDLGYEIWCEPTVRLGHIGHITIYPEMREQYQEQLGIGWRID